MKQDKGKLIPFERKRPAPARSIHVAGLRFRGIKALIRALLPDKGNTEIHRDVPMRSNGYPARQAAQSSGVSRSVTA
jgi:hypothetical protein